LKRIKDKDIIAALYILTNEVFTKKDVCIQCNDVFFTPSLYAIVEKTSIIIVARKDDIQDVFLTIESRLQYASMVRKSLSSLSSLPKWKQCIQKEFKLNNPIGK